MRPLAEWFATLLALALPMTSACVRHEIPRTVSDICLHDKPIRFDVAAGPGQDDPGNRFDTDATVADLIEHNAVLRRLCEKQ